MFRLVRRSCVSLTALVLALAISACATIRLVSDYDQQIDQTATQLQKGMDAFLTKIETLPTNDTGRAYAANHGFYDAYGVDLRSLKARAKGHAKNSITVQQLELMEASVEELRKTHKAQNDLSNPAIDEYRVLFNTAWTGVLTFELAKKR